MIFIFLPHIKYIDSVVLTFFKIFAMQRHTSQVANFESQSNFPEIKWRIFANSEVKFSTVTYFRLECWKELFLSTTLSWYWFLSLFSVLREDYFVRVSPSAASLSKSNEVVEVTSGNSLVLRCEVSRSALASHLIVDSWQPQSSNRLIRLPSHQNHYKGL